MGDLKAREFSGRKTAEIVGISYRQLDYWARTDLIRPSLTDASGSGFRRSYSESDLRALLVVKALLDGGVKLEAVRQALPQVRSHVADGGTGFLVITSDGARVSPTAEALADEVEQSIDVVLVLPLGTIAIEVEARRG